MDATAIHTLLLAVGRFVGIDAATIGGLRRRTQAGDPSVGSIAWLLDTSVRAFVEGRHGDARDYADVVLLTQFGTLVYPCAYEVLRTNHGFGRALGAEFARGDPRRR